MKEEEEEERVKERAMLRSGARQTILPRWQRAGVKAPGPHGFTASKKACMSEENTEAEEMR